MRLRTILMLLAVLGPAAGAANSWLSKSIKDLTGELQPTKTSAAPAARAGKGAMQPVHVERVLDGDTVIVMGWQQRVRLANVDAPEMSHGYGKPGQPYSQQSTQWLTRELQGRPDVSVRCHEADRYGRQICDFYRGDTHINKELVRAGMAWANTANARYLRDKSVLIAQEEAQSSKRGLWGQASAVQPWNWRRECWDQQRCGN